MTKPQPPSDHREGTQTKKPARSEHSRGLVSPARGAAFEILMRVFTSEAHSDDLLHGPGMSSLSQLDRDLTMALVLGVLRWQSALEARLEPLLSRPDAVLAEPVAMSLRLGAFQLLHMERIPPHAVLNESVELVRKAGHPHAAGMVNAVLRKLSVQPASRKPIAESLAAMAERLAHPHWIVERWARHYGRSAAEAICNFDQQEPTCAQFFEAQSEVSLPVMDAGSRLVAEIAAEVGGGAARVWDCCAAPGGKTLVMARRLPGATLLATDANPSRTRRLEQRVLREGLAEQVVVRHTDAGALAAGDGPFDLILCDVPCSGTGTLARNPEIRQRLQLGDLRRQANRQQLLLKSALGHLAPGGKVVYSTCSLEPEECEQVVTRVREGDSAVAVVPAQGVLETLRSRGRLRDVDMTTWTRGDYLRTLPGVGFQGDGFFTAVLERR